MPEHQIALAADQFAELIGGVKTFDTRRDAGYGVGSILCFQEYEPVVQSDVLLGTDINTTVPSGRTARRRVSHILRGTDWLPRGFVIMALQDVYGPEDAVWRELHKRALPRKGTD